MLFLLECISLSWIGLTWKKETGIFAVRCKQTLTICLLKWWISLLIKGTSFIMRLRIYVWFAVIFCFQLHQIPCFWCFRKFDWSNFDRFDFKYSLNHICFFIFQNRLYTNALLIVFVSFLISSIENTFSEGESCAFSVSFKVSKM